VPSKTEKRDVDYLTGRRGCDGERRTRCKAINAPVKPAGLTDGGKKKKKEKKNGERLIHARSKKIAQPQRRTVAQKTKEGRKAFTEDV